MNGDREVTPVSNGKIRRIALIAILLIIAFVSMFCLSQQAGAQALDNRLTVVFRPVNPDDFRSAGILLLSSADPRLEDQLDSAIVVTFEGFESTYPLNWGPNPGGGGPGNQATILVGEELKEVYFLTSLELQFGLTDAKPWRRTEQGNGIIRQWRQLMPLLGKTVSN
jgi:hypothetical protein